MPTNRLASPTEEHWLRTWASLHADQCNLWRTRRCLPFENSRYTRHTETFWGQRCMVAAHDTANRQPASRSWMELVRTDLARLPAAFDGTVPPELALIECAAGTVPMFLPQRAALYVPHPIANLLPLPLLIQPSSFTRRRYASSAWVLLDALRLQANVPSPVFLEDSHFIAYPTSPASPDRTPVGLAQEVPQ